MTTHDRRLLWALAAVSLGALGSCRSGSPPSGSSATGAAAPAPELATSEFRTPRGLAVTIRDTNELDSYEPFEASAIGAPNPDNYAGSDRKKAKLSIAPQNRASPVEYESLSELLYDRELLKSDRFMMNRNPPISKASDSDRVSEEDNNVAVFCYLFAAAKEDDNDYHLIIGSVADKDSAVYMNVELSGLPTGGVFRAPLKDVRDDFKAFFGSNLPGATYRKFDPPIPVKITGSLFYDISHKPNVVGPADMRPRTAWELHPLTAIEFEPANFPDGW